MKNILILFFLIFIPFLSFSQIDIISERPSFDANYIDQSPEIDGNVINDNIWKSVPSIGPFTQTKPLMGNPSSEETDLKIAFTKDFMFIGVVCYDSSPNTLVVSDSRRDANLDNDDSFLFIVDTYNDQQNGFLFGTNSAGMEYDAQIDNEGVGNRTAQRQQGGVVGGTNLNWDASWIVKTQIGEYGWSAEFAIPLKSLRFSTGDNKIWGINFQRNISKTNEISYWAPLPLGFNFSIKRVSLAGKMNKVSLKKPGNLKLLPYALTQLTNFRDKKDLKTNIDGGADLKYSITPSLTLDLTYNTDFAQAEVDKQQVNLDRFNLFYPEKRAFFLENAGQFSVGSPGEIDLFFSRKIGISSNGSIVPIKGGGRLSGKIGNTNIGLLSMITDASDQLNSKRNNYYVTRVNHNFNNSRSSIGAAFIGKTISKDLNELNYNNNVFAVDGIWGIGKKAKISGFVSKSSTPGINNNNHAFKFSANYDWNSWNIYAQYSEVGDGFKPEVGYLERSSFKKPSFLIFKTIRVNDNSKLLEYRPHISGRYYYDLEGNIVTTYTHIDTHWAWKNGFEVHTGYNIRKEWVSENFDISNLQIKTGEYNNSEFQFVLMTNKSKNLSFNTRSYFGAYFGGYKISNNASLNFRSGDKFSTLISINANNIKVKGEVLNAVISGLNLTYSFTPRMFLQSFIQYNNVSNLFSVNTRFGLLNDANTGLFVVFNILKDSDIIDEINNQQITIKYTHSFDLIK
tara:strand:- start:2007 stop:4217 length:2211 start_codon:yes stop_codon:yes gene_type:complete